MAFFDSKVSKFLIDDTGSVQRDLSAYVTEVRGLPGRRNLNEVTALGDSGAKFIAGLEDVDISLSGIFDDTATTGPDAVLGPLRTHTSAVSFEYGPEGSGTGHRDNQCKSAMIPGRHRKGAEYGCPSRAREVVRMDKIRVLIVDDNARLRQELARVLSSDESLEIVGEAADGNEAVQQARALKPHAVVMDLNMPVSDGVDATRRMQAEMRDVPVLILTVSDAEADLVRALAAGARGYLLKNEDAQQIKQAIHYVIRGGTLMSPLMADKLRLELEKLGPAVDETAARTQQAREAETVEEKAVAPAKKPRRDEGTRKASPDGPQDFVSDVDLLISPPIQPGAVLRFHRLVGGGPKGPHQ